MGILFSMSLVACTQNDEIDELLLETETQGCCGEGGQLPPPPPPPPPPGGGSGGNG